MHSDHLKMTTISKATLTFEEVDETIFSPRFNMPVVVDRPKAGKDPDS